MNETSAVPEPRTLRISPWVLTILASILLPLGFVGILAVALWFEPATLQPDNARVLPDGSILRLEKVTRGTARHNFDMKFPVWPYIFGQRVRSFQHYAHGNGDERLVLWFTRRDAKSGRYLDFDWWKHSVGTDKNGVAFIDTAAYLEDFSEYGSSSRGGTRPLKSEPSHPYHIGHSQMRVFRPRDDGTFELKVYNATDVLVATFNVPMPAGPPPVELKPESLPSTKIKGDLALTLKSLVAKESPYEDWNAPLKPFRSPLNLQVDAEILWQGKPTVEWQFGLNQVSDPFGNKSYAWNSDLSPKEPWSVRLQASRKESAKFEPLVTAVVPAMSLPETDKVLMLGQTLKVDGVAIELLFSGRGKIKHSVSVSSTGEGSSSASMQPFGIPGQVEGKAKGGVCALTVDCKLPFIAMRQPTGLGPNDSLILRGKAASGENIEWRYTCGIWDMQFWFGNASEMQSAMDLTIIVNRGQEFEYVIQPPTPVPLPLPPK